MHYFIYYKYKKRGDILNYIAGTLFTLVFGTLLHFVYQWSGYNPVVALFAPINESVFEHMKLLFVPYLIWSLIELGKIGSWENSFFPRKAFSVLVGMLFIILFFYFYTNIFHKNFLAADIGLFVIGTILTFSLDYLMKVTGIPCNNGLCAFGTLLMLIMVLMFPVFTFCPPALPLFQEPY